MGAYLTFEMLGSTSWTTYSHSDKFVAEEEFGPVTYETDTEMGIGLREVTLFLYLEECDEDNRCYDVEFDEKYEITQNWEAGGDLSFDCENTEDSEEIKMCDADSAGSTAHSIIIGGLGLLGLTLFLACISVVGYIQGWIVRLLNSVSGIIVLVGPIVWFVMLPDLNSGLESGEQKWRLAHAFYLSLLGGPIIFLGGWVFGSMEAFGLEKYEDWDDDDYDDDEYSQISQSMSQKENSRPQQQEEVDVNLQGAWGDDGYEWIEHPEGSEIWYWRDQETGQWVRH